MTYLRDEGVNNLVVLTGDIHAHFAGVVMDDYDVAVPAPVGVELSVAGVSSNSLFSFYEDATRGSGIPLEVRNLITFDASGDGGPRFVENMNLLLLHGTAAANTMANTNDLTQAMADADPTANPHLRYADTNAQGYGVLVVSATEIEATLVTIDRPVTGDGPSVKRRATFTVASNDPGGMSQPAFTGTPPFPYE
jgi:alkaline phosphatase D